MIYINASENLLPLGKLFLPENCLLPLGRGSQSLVLGLACPSIRDWPCVSFLECDKLGAGEHTDLDRSWMSAQQPWDAHGRKQLMAPAQATAALWPAVLESRHLPGH